MASSSGFDAGKTALRSSYLDLCKHLPKQFHKTIDGSVRHMLGLLPEYKASELVLAYVSFHEEIDTKPLIEQALQDGKTVALPVQVTDDDGLAFYTIASLDGLVPFARGIKENPACVQRLTTQDFLGSVCLVPGLVFDAEGYRVGYGAGYYDEFLRFYPGYKVGLVRSVQVSSNPLPHDKTDVPVDILVTEGSIWRCRASE